MKKKLKILHLEDNAFDAEIICRTLENANVPCSIKRIDTREAFLGELDNHDYDMILSDYMMPDFDAFSALKIVRERNESIPFLIVSGAIGEEIAIDSLKKGVTDYVFKNRLTRLAPSIQRIIDEREKQAALSMAERNVAASHAELRALAASAIDGVLSFTPQGRIRIFNDASVQLFQYQSEELYQVNASHLIPGIKKILKQKSIKQHRTIGIRKDGSKIELEISLSTYHVEENENHMLILRDITDRILLEESLLDSQAHAQLGSWALNMLTNEIKWSEETFRIFDISANNKPPLFEEYFSMVAEEDQKTLKTVITRAIVDKEPYSIDHRIVTAKGIMKWVQARGKLILDEDESISHLQGTIQDITERKKYEEELKRRNEELDTFVYRISHDLRSPICTIQGLVNMYQNDPVKNNHPEYIKLIKSTINKLFVFIDQTLSHSENLNTPIRSHLVDFEEIIRDVVYSHKQLPEWPQVKVKTQVSAGDYYSDVDRLKVIFNVMLSNAFRFFDRNKKQSIANIEITNSNSFIHITFHDNGVGIPEEVLPKIFDMFYRGNELSSGSGLGLYILKQYVDKMKGTVNVNSVLSEGTTFEIMLPNLN
jgi:PAS domain S-box-containing protein